MKRILFLALLFIGFINEVSAKEASMKQEVATFGGGCFGVWRQFLKRQEVF